MTRAPADLINHPPHYTAGPPCPQCGEVIECITITEGRDFLTGNALKYLWRAGLKGVALTDLLKARWYVDRAIQREQARSATERPAGGPSAPSAPEDSRQPTPGVYETKTGAWARNSYTDLHARIVGPATDDGGLFPSGWTPETDNAAIMEGE